jgi:processive 1,2-diacylglycerol beta-glucosyltransferase
MSHKILVCSAGFGEGHNTAAHNLCTALVAVAPDQVEAEFVDIFARTHPRTNDLFRRGYLTLMNKAPRLWSTMYRLFDSNGMLEKNLVFFNTLRDALAELLEKEQPSAVVLTYPLYGYLLNAVAQRGGPANFLRVMVVTDSISINSVWYRCGSDFFSVPNEETAAVLRQGGVPAEKVRVLGFPVEPRFAALDTLPPRPDPAGPEGRRVLYMINAGRKAAEEVLRQLLAIPDIELTVTVGRDLKMRATVERLIGAYDRTRAPVQVIGWTREVPALLASHHVLISKAGGATTQEAIAARCPMIISQVAPGQEEGNAQLLVDNHAGCLALTPERIGETVREAFADDAKICREWTHHIARLSRPAAAQDNARFILEQIEARAR